MSAASSGSEQAPSFSSPEEEALLTLMRSADCLHRAFQQKLKPFGITANQYNVLRILRGARPSGMTCSAIGRGMITPEPDITRLLGRLKAQKLLCQNRDSEDRRVVWTRVTAQGMELLAQLDGIVEQTPRELFRRLSEREIQELTRLLKKARCCAGSKGGLEEEVPDGIRAEALASEKPHSPSRQRLPPRSE